MGLEGGLQCCQIATMIASANNLSLNEKRIAPIGDKLDTHMRDIEKLSICELSKQS